MDAKTERGLRLAEALRANLRRRKAQARAIDTDPAADAPAPDGDPSDRQTPESRLPESQ